MLVYSKKIVHFIQEIKRLIKTSLELEVRLKVHGDRFQNKNQTASYPIKVVVYNNKSMLGYFDSNFYELGFHECLMHTSHEQLLNIIRHELAHYITFIEHGNVGTPHGAEFRSFCTRMHWGEEVYRATTCLDDGQNIAFTEEKSVLRKVQKLMALATSSNQNEAEQAMIKSQQLLLKHNIDSKYIGGEDEEKVFLKRILKQKKENAKMRAIARILETFFVGVVYNRGGEHIHLEIIGNEVNIEIAEYVAGFLQIELENLWEQAQKEANLKGAVAKNSFFLGLAKGYCDKIESLKRGYSGEVTTALMVIEKQLVDAKAMAYGRLSSRTSSGSHCSASARLGEMMGSRLNINPAVGSASKQGALLGYS